MKNVSKEKKRDKGTVPQVLDMFIRNSGPAGVTKLVVDQHAQIPLGGSSQLWMKMLHVDHQVGHGHELLA